MLQSTGSQRAGLNFEKPTTMLTLPSKLKQGGGLKESWVPRTASDSTRRVSVRDRLLVKGKGHPVSYVYIPQQNDVWHVALWGYEAACCC